MMAMRMMIPANATPQHLFHQEEYSKQQEKQDTQTDDWDWIPKSRNQELGIIRQIRG